MVTGEFPLRCRVRQLRLAIYVLALVAVLVLASIEHDPRGFWWGTEHRSAIAGFFARNRVGVAIGWTNGQAGRTRFLFGAIDDPHADEFARFTPSDARPGDIRWDFCSFRFAHRRDATIGLQHLIVVVPIGALAVFPSLLIARRVYRWQRSRRWAATGHCGNCGYPLVGVDRCSECGTPATPANLTQRVAARSASPSSPRADLPIDVETRA